MGRHARLITQGEIEELILRIADEMETETERYSDLATVAADAEADYKLRAARALISMANAPQKMTAADRQARAEVIAADELRTWKLSEARRQATKEALLTLRARLDALRSLAANVRHQT
jgi:hypothetical protein